MPSIFEEVAAEKLKAEGNALFAKQKFSAAAEVGGASHVLLGELIL